METFDVKDDLKDVVYPLFGRKDESNNTPTPYEKNSKEEKEFKQIVKIDSKTFKIKDYNSCVFIFLFWLFVLIDLIASIMTIIESLNPKSYFVEIFCCFYYVYFSFYFWNVQN